MEGENVSPTTRDNDYQDVFPASRLLSIDRGANLGTAPCPMCQEGMRASDPDAPFMFHQFVGWLAAHDVVPSATHSAVWSVLAAENEFWRDDAHFLPYWKTTPGVASKTDGVIVSALLMPKRALLWVVNTQRKDLPAVIYLDLRKLGLNPQRTRIFDAETGEAYPLRNGQLTLPVPSRLWRAVRLFEPELLKGDETFVAHFERGEVGADEALGHRYSAGMQVEPATAHGKAGNGVDIDKVVTFSTRLHLQPSQGEVSIQAKVNAQIAGTLLVFNNKLTTPEQSLILRLGNGKITLSTRTAMLTSAPMPAGEGWHAFHVVWQGQDFRVTMDGAPLLRVTLADPMPIDLMRRGLDDAGMQLQNPGASTISFGQLPGAVIDDLVMYDRMLGI